MMAQAIGSLPEIQINFQPGPVLVVKGIWVVRQQVAKPSSLHVCLAAFQTHNYILKYKNNFHFVLER